MQGSFPLSYVHTLPDSSFAGTRKNTRLIRLLLTHKNGDQLGAISACNAMEHCTAAPIGKVERHLSDRCCATVSDVVLMAAEVNK